MTKANEDIRKEISDAGFKMWQIADIYGINDGNFSRKLRKELPVDEKLKIKEIIKQLKEVQLCHN